MEKYVLSKKCRIVDLKSIRIRDTTFREEILKLERKESFLLEKAKRRYIINGTIKTFLEYFDHPISLEFIIDKITAQIQCQKEEIENQIRDFFEQMCKNEILISEDNYNKQSNASCPDVASVELGTIINGYKFIERIFINSKVEIYKVISVEKNIVCAAKILRKDRVNSRTIKIFFQEFEMLKAIGIHNHICKVIDIVETEDKTFGVLEFVDGLSGRKYINKTTPSPTLRNRLKVLTQFFDGMAFIHNQSITHGDLHLSNLLIDKNNYLKIIDFNMSNRSIPLENELVHEGGVYQYISPEKVNSGLFKIVNGPASFSSEVYQMGIISYFFLYEKMPFNGFTWEALSNEILYGKPIFDAFTPNGELIPVSVINFVNKMLAKIPENRFQNAAKLSESWKMKQQSIFDNKILQKVDKLG